MEYISQSLTFTDHSILLEGNHTPEIMMDWEDTLMSASAAYVCENGGDILEIGFGMGISATYIQSHSINSHTIIEPHPQIITKAKEWAVDKSNVTIIEGKWYDVKDTLSTYDGVFYDASFDDDIYYFRGVLPSLMKEGGKATWWNPISDEDNWHGFTNVTYDVYDVNPPTNQYFTHLKYYLPKKQF